MNNAQIVQQVNDLNDKIQQVGSNSQYLINLTWTILGVVVAVIGVALYFLAKILVDSKVNKEIDKRLIDLLKSNPPIFIASGSSVPDVNRKIYLSHSIPGIEQLDPDTAISIDIISENLIVGNIDGSIKIAPVLRVNENGIVEIEVQNYTINNGKIHWKIIWPRSIYTK